MNHLKEAVWALVVTGMIALWVIGNTLVWFWLMDVSLWGMGGALLTSIVLPVLGIAYWKDRTDGRGK